LAHFSPALGQSEHTVPTLPPELGQSLKVTQITQHVISNVKRGQNLEAEAEAKATRPRPISEG